MTPEELSARYGPLKQLTSAPVRSVLAMRTATKAIVMLHHFESGPDDPSRDLLTLVEFLPDEKKQRVVERLEVNGVPIIVTKMLHNFVSLEAWMTSLAGPDMMPLPPSPRPGETPPPPLPPANDATMVISPKEAPKGPPVAPASPSPLSGIAAPFTDQVSSPAASPPPPAAPADERDPGDFTALFMAPKKPAAPSPPVQAPPPAAPPPAPPPAAAAKDVGDFTALFQAPAAPRPDPRANPSSAPPPSVPVAPPPPARDAKPVFTPPAFEAPTLPAQPAVAKPVVPPTTVSPAKPLPPPAPPSASPRPAAPAAGPAFTPPALSSPVVPGRVEGPPPRRPSATPVVNPVLPPRAPQPPRAAPPPGALPPRARPMDEPLSATSSFSSPVAPPPKVPPPPPPAGDFTQLFSGATPPPRGAPPPRAAAPPPEAPGNFTQLFSPKQSDPPPDDLSRRLNQGMDPTPGMHGATGTSMPAQRPPAPSQPQKPPEQGDFTKMFSAPSQPPGPGSASGSSSGADYTDSLYGSTPASGGGTPPSSAGSAAPPPAPGGSEYTRALKRVSIGDMSPAKGAKPAGGAPVKGGENQPATPADDDGEKKPNYLPIILIVVGLIVVLVIVVVAISSLSGL